MGVVVGGVVGGGGVGVGVGVGVGGVVVVVVVCNHLFPPVGTRVLPKCISIDSFIL